MKSIVKTIIFSALVASGAVFPAKASDPLMVVRFNNPDVNYQTSLSMAVSEAVRVKKDAIFDVVSGNGAHAQAEQVVKEISKAGVDSNNITLSPSGNNNKEVLVFVR